MNVLKSLSSTVSDRGQLRGLRACAASALLAIMLLLAGCADESAETAATPVPPPSAPASSAAPAGTAGPSASQTPAQSAQAESYDVVLIGSELEGLYLARAAADEGLRVKILDPMPRVGGQVLLGEMLFLDDVKDDSGKSLTQGRVKELFDGFKSGKIRKLPEYEAYFAKLMQGLPVESGVTILGVREVPGIPGQTAVAELEYKTSAGETRAIRAGYWVENTDNASLVSKLKATRMPGLEAFYGQSNIEYMSAGYMMKFKNVDWKKFQTHFNSMTAEERSAKYGPGWVDGSYAINLSGMTKRYKPSNDRVFMRGLNAINQRDGEVLINALLIYTVDPADPKSVAEAIELGQKEIPAILEHFRRNIVGWEHAEINGYPSYLYIREYNHYETDYVLKPSDLLGAKMFWDNVSIAGYALDLQGTSANKWGIEMGRPDKYGMPLRSFLLKNYENVIMAGKNVGASAIAYGSARIQPNTSLAAESIGVILGQIHGKKKLKELTEADMPALHQTLEQKYKIKLTGVKGASRLVGWTADEIAKLDTGEIVYAQYKNKKK